MGAQGLGWLTRRLVLSRRDGVSSILVLGAAIAFLAMLLMATIAVPQIAAKQSQRNDARTPILNYSNSAARNARLLTLEPELTSIGSRWGSHAISRQAYATRGGGAPQQIPGIRRAPRPSEYFASPALAGLIRTDPTVRALFAGRQMVGIIGHEGLVQPHELRAIEGVAPDSQLLYAVRGFGPSDDVLDSGAPTQLTWSVITAATISVWAPGVVLLVVCSRFASRSRAARARTLRIQGMSARSVRLLMAAEVAVIALPSAAIGVLAYSLLVQLVTDVPGTSFGYYSSDATLPWGTTLVALLAVAFVSALAAAYSFRLNKSEPVVVRRRAPRRTVVIGLVLFCVGVSYLVLTPLIVRYTDYASAGIWPAIGCVLAGVAIAGPQLVMIWSRKAASRSKNAGSVMGLRLSSWTVTTSMRLGTLGAVLIIVMLGTVAFVNVLTSGSTKTWSEAMGSNPTVGASVNDLTRQLRRADIAPVARNHAVAERVEVPVIGGSDKQMNVVLASCHDLSELTGSSVSGCAPEGVWIQTGAGRAPKGANGSIKLNAKHRLTLPESSRVVRVLGGPEGFNGALLLPTDSIRSAGATFYFVVDGKRAEEAFATISGRSMTSQFELGKFDSVWPGFRQYQAQYEWLIVGIVGGAICGALTLLCAVLGERVDRLRRFDGMVALGASRRDLVSTHYWATTWPVLVIGFVGVSVGWLVTHEMGVFDDRACVPAGLFLGSFIAVVLVAFGIATVSIRDPLRRASL